MTVPQQSMITDEHRARVGKPTEPVRVKVRAEDAARMRDVIGDKDPRYADGSEIAPPYTLAGIGGGHPGMAPMILPNAILTQQEWRFSRPFKIGEELDAVSQVIDLRDRLGGRYGYSILAMTSTDYYDLNGEHVAAVLMTVTQFDPKGLQQRGDE